MHLLAFLFAFCIWQCRPANAAMPICDTHIYGIPVESDCLRALKKVPFATNKEDNDITAPHYFVEPQLMPRPFVFVSNNYRPKRIIQLPKIWKHNSCRLALMSLGLSHQPVAVRPTFISSWKQVISQSSKLLRCASHRNPRGGYIAFEMRSTAVAAALYIYTTGSVFEARMNAYMSDGLPVVPIAPRGFWDRLGSNASTVDNALSLDLLNSSMAGMKTAGFKLLDSE